jgi:hypothetical protein
MRVQITSKKTLHVNDCQGRNINTNIAEVHAKDVVFPTVDNIELVNRTSIKNMQDFGTVRIFTTPLFSNKQV